MRYAGATMRTARNPNITARETIELANWIAELKSSLSCADAMYVEADNKREDLQAERQTHLDLALTAGRDRLKLVERIAFLETELKKIADLTFDTLNGPTGDYYHGIKESMSIALAAWKKSNG